MKHLHRCRFALAAAAASAMVALLAASCGEDRSPSVSTPPASPPATPTPDTGGGVASSSCPIGKGSLAVSCEPDSPLLLRYVESAIDLLVRERPHILDLSSELVPNTDQFRVLDAEDYLDAVVENLRRQGVCAERDPDDLNSQQVLVKEENGFSETFDVLTETGFVRRGRGAYVETCTPASFPVDRTADMPPAGSGCGRPYPPEVSRFNIKIHLRAREYYTLDATPIVGPDNAYCSSVGFAGRSICPVRPEGSEDRGPCEAWRVGRATDTGRVGPTWTNGEGGYCTGPESGCENAPNNQFQLRVYRSDTFKACAESGVCSSFVFAR